MTVIQPAVTRRPYASLSVFLTLFCLLTLGTTAHAQVTVSLLADYLAGNAGDTLSYQGTLANTGDSEVFLSGDLFNLTGDDLTVDDSPFLNNFPPSLLGGESFTAEMFTVTIGPTTPQGTYTGTFTILGGLSEGDFNPLTTQTFHLVVGAPEPGTGFLLLVGAAFVGATLRQRVTR